MSFAKGLRLKAVFSRRVLVWIVVLTLVLAVEALPDDTPAHIHILYTKRDTHSCDRVANEPPFPMACLLQPDSLH